MPAGINTQVGLGIRRMITSLPTGPEYRNFEINGEQLYKVVMAPTTPFVHGGAVVTTGDTIPYDSADGLTYTDAPILEMYFNAGIIDPVD